MKLKHFIFALVAMMSLTLSAFAQTTMVDNEANLRMALSSATSSEVVLVNDIELNSSITIAKNVSHTLNLNGYKVVAKSTFNDFLFKVNGNFTINDTKGGGELIGTTKTIYVVANATATINGGKFYSTKGTSYTIYATGNVVVNGGSILNNGSSVAIFTSGAYSNVTLNGGTITSVDFGSKGALNITDSDVTIENGLTVSDIAKGVNISAGTINGDITIADEAKDKVTVTGGIFEDKDAIEGYLPDGSALLDKGDGTFEVVAGMLRIKETGVYYPTLAAALTAAQDGATIELINLEGSVIAMNGALYGKSVTITGTAKVDWSKGFLFVARGGAGNATLTFDNANLTSVSNSASCGIHVSGREKGTADKYDGTVVIKNSTIALDFLINKGAMTLDNATLTVKNGFDLNGRPASETENGEDANATMALTNNSTLVVNNHNGMGIGREGKGELTVDASSTFEHTQDFLVCANGTMDVKGTLVSNGKKLTNNGEVKFTDVELHAATIEGTGTTRFYNTINFHSGANSITTGINGTPFHLVVNDDATLLISRFVLGYDRNITVNGTIANNAASTFNPEGQTPSLKFNSTSGVSVGGTGTGNLQVKNAYIELGNSSWKSDQGTYDWDFTNCYVSATSFTNPTGADAATWDVTFNNSILAAKNYIKNGKNVTYNFTNNSHGTTGSLRIDGVLNIDATSSVTTLAQQNNKVGAEDEHGGINGTVNVAGTLTIGSNAKTQLEVLGGKVNVEAGATLALGNNTMTLDAASALTSAGNISGAITAADGADVAISGGTYTQDVTNWCAEGFMTQQNADGTFGIVKAAAKVGDKKYASLEEAFKAATSGCTIDILSDVTIDYNWDARNTGGKFTVPVIINGNGKTIKFTASVNDNNYQAPFRFEADATIENLTIDMSEVTDNRFRAISSKGNLTVDNCKFFGKDESLNCRAIIFGEGAGANVGNLAISITNSEFRNWKRGITDNENGQDVKTVIITENKLTNAGVFVSAKKTVTFTGNTVEGAYVNIKSYTAGNKLAVTATGNTLEANTDAANNVIDAGGVVNAEGFKIVAKGNNFNGYTSADGIWGEVWGNAKESFVIKVLDANGNVMGTTSLNNIGGIINGNVNVSWNLKFNAAANTDEYWTMEWTTAPSISNMPARVALWVDGVEVSGGPVVLNGPDDLNKIVAAVTDADGKIISCHTSVANAAATKATNIALLRNTTEEISLPVGTILNKNGFTADRVTVKQPIANIGATGYATFAEALAAVENGQTITIIDNAEGDEKSTELEFTKAIKFTITGKAPKYALPVITFQNAEVTIKDAEILIPELDARQNAVINIVNSTIHDAGGNSIAKSYYNGTINIDETSTVYMMQITTMGYINVAGTVNATWQTNVYGNGMIALENGAKFNTGALHLTGQDYSGRDNTDADRVGKPATIVVDAATLNVGSVKSDNGADYSYNSSKGINIGTVDGKSALLDVKNGGAVNFYMANGQTTNFGAGATVNVASSTLKTISRDANGTVTLANAGVVNVTGASNLNIKNYSGNAINATNTILADVQFGGAVNAFGTNNISGTSVIGGILSLGYGTNPTEQVVVNITGNFNGTNVLVYTNNGIDNILNVGNADERTTVHFGQLGAFADVNVVNTDVTYGYAFIRNDFNATNSAFAIKGGVNTYFSGNAKVVLDNTTWNLSGYANIGSYGGYMYGNADVTLKNGSQMTATNLGVEVSGENVVKVTLEDNSNLTATKLTNQGTIVLAGLAATLTSNECGNVKTTVDGYFVSYINGTYKLIDVTEVKDSGTWGGIDWSLTYEGTLTIAPTAGEPVPDKNAPTKRTYEVGEWRETVIYKSNGSASAIGGAPYDMKAVKKLIIKEGVTKIGSFTCQFPNLTGEVVIPSTVTYFGQEAFHKTPITKLTFAAGGTESLCIANGVFKKTLIEEVSFPGDRPSIEIHHWAFGGSPNLKTAYIPANLTKVWGGEHVDYFDNFNSQTNPSWTNTGSIFTGCTAMETITFETEEIRDFFFAGNRQGTAEDPMVAAADLVAYNSLDKAIAAATDDIILCKSATLKDTWTIAAGKDMTLNLNGKTLSQSKACTTSYQMIENNGSLTITGNGKISFTDTGAGDPSFGWGSYTIRNAGNLVVENGTIEHKGAQSFATHCIMAIYQYSGSTTINGGKISTPNYRSARLWKGDMTINGGTFDGQVWVQAVDNSAKLTINGGTFSPKGNDASSVFVTNNQYDVQLAVTDDGTFNGKVGCSDAAKLAGVITGGKFTETAKNGTNVALLGNGLIFGDVVENGYYGLINGLKGKGSPEAPYMITSVEELEIFRTSVNKGETKYNAPGVWVALGADIDLANAEWTVGIGDGHNYSFDGNFDGKNHTIKNLNVKPYADADGYLCGGLFGYTFGGVTIKNLVIENAKVEFANAATDGKYHNVGILVGFANNKDGKLNVDNVTVKGDIKVDAPKTFGVGTIVGYSYREMGAITNTNVLANEGSYIKGERFVGGIIGYSYDNAVISNCTVENLAISGTNGVAGIAGLALNGNKIELCTVKNVTVTGDNNWAYIVGELGSGNGADVTIADNCVAPQPWVGGSYGSGEAFVAKVGTKYYTSIDEAMTVAQAGDVVTIFAGEFTQNLNVNKDITVEGQTDADGNNLVKFNGKLNITADGATVKNITVKNTGTSTYINAKDVLVENCSLEGSNGLYQSYTKGNVTFRNSVITGATYGVHFDGSAGGNIVIENCIITGWTSFAGTITNVEITKTTFANGTYNQLRFYQNAQLNECVFNEDMTIDFGKNEVEAQFEDCTVENGGDLLDVIYTGDIAEMGVKVIIDGESINIVAKAQLGENKTYYQTLIEAVEAAQNGAIVTLLQDVTYDDNDVFEGTKGKTMIEISGKNITLDLNGKTINASYSGPNYLMSVIHVTDGAGLTVTGNGFINVNGLNAEGAAAKNIAYVFYKSGETGYLNIENGTFHMNDAADSMVYTNGDEIVTINGGTFILDAVASQTNGFPVIFNTAGNNERHIIVNGGTFNYDINHQIRPFEPYVAPEKAVKANGDGTWTIDEAEAYVTEMLGGTVYEAGQWPHKVGYATLAEAVAAINDLGNKVTMVKDVELTETITIAADKTMVFDLNGKIVSMNDASGATAALIRNNGNLTITDGTEAKAGKLSFTTTTPSAANAYASNTISNYGVITIEGGNVENLSVGGGACYALDNYAGSTANINGGKLTAEKTTVRIFNWTDGEAAKATINMNGGKIYSKDGYGININSGNAPFVALNIAGGTISTDDTDYNLAVYVVNKGTAENFTANVTGGTFNGIFALNGVTARTMKQDAVVVSGGTFEGVTCYDDPAYGFVKGGTFESAVDAKYVATGYICKDNGDGTYGVIVDPGYGKVAQIGNSDDYFANKYFATINEAAQAAQDGETITLIADVEMSAEGYATITDNYAVMVAVKEKDITIDLNGKTVTVTPTAEELAEAEGEMLMSVFGLDTDGKLTLTGEGTVKVNANANDANVYSLAAAYGEGALLTIESGNYEADAVNASGSLIYSQQTGEGEGVIVYGGNFKLGNEGTGANDSPWIFNTKGKNQPGIKVVGGTYPTDINHQFWANEVFVPETLAVKANVTANSDTTWTIVEAVAYTNEKAKSQGSYRRHVGYATIEEAIAATGMYNCEDNKVTMVKDVEITKTITVANGETIVLDLNGKTIAATDNTSKNYSAIDNRGNLTITDGSEEGTGKMTVVATVNSGWGRYSAVIANNPGGSLTIEDATIEHLGGTDMAYGIDNLTNGKGTYAETVINGGLVKSTYFAVRQFLNGVEAQNILTVNGGTLEGADQTKSIFFQDPSAQANSGTLYVGKEARLNGDVYIWGAEGSTEWPVEIYVAKAALEEGESEVIAENLPAGYTVVDEETYWTIKVSIDTMTIVDECDEFVNLTIKEVDELTYERNFVDTMWQTLYLPFAIPYATLSDEFDVAYIYNASAKGGNINVDIVKLDETTDATFTLAANYPYLIRAKEAGVKSIVVDSAVVMPTPNAITIDCSSVFETFSFIGSYTTIDAENLDTDNGYFELTTGGWTIMETIYPFRVYMQIENRDGSSFDYTTAKVLVRRVDEEGNVQEIISISGETVEGELEGEVEEEESQKEDMIFDLNGRRITEPVKGLIYIINGQKVLY